ncbi:MAG TPA: DinB family protein [Thermoanaerobaculia bacterium]|nr:DinB family protein [Thermoanaerobaculia bacterium]
MDDKDQSLRDHLVKLLRGGGAHLDLDKAIQDLPHELRGKKAAGLPHTVWQLLEHLRLAQWDILEFSRSRNHVSPKFPDGYWPGAEAPDGEDAWKASVEAFHQDRKAMEDLVTDPETDLYAKIPWGDGQTILREAMLIADHNAYHLGQIVSLRQVLGAWEEK